MDNITLGIDLGTTYSAMAYVDEHGEARILANSDNENITPSVVYFETKDNTIIGQSAKDMIDFETDNVVSFVKREMGKNKDEVRKEDNYGEPKPYDFFGKRYSPEEISSLILKKLKKDAEAHFQGKEITDVVITVPAYFNDSEKQATRDAGQMAGFNVLQVINEPTAAAIAYGVSNEGSTSQRVFVFDLGGGTFDVTVLDVVNINGKKEINVINTDGDHRLGGKDWDDKIIEFFAEKFIEEHGADPRDDENGMATLRIESEKIKKKLSTSDRPQGIVLRTDDNTSKFRISKTEFEDLCSDLLSQTEGLCNTVLSDANLTWSDINTILLVGGSTRMPMVVEMLSRISGKEIRTDLIQPDECVAKGAAIKAMQFSITDTSGNIKAEVSQKLKDTIGSIQVNDIVTQTLGLVTVNSNDENVVTPMIPKQTKTPFKYQETFGTNTENQSNVLLQIKEGEGTNPDIVPTIQEATLQIVSNLPSGSPIEVTYDIGADGKLTVIAKDVTNNKEITVKVETNSGYTEESIRQSTEDLKRINVS
ncbi:MAG: Hsp70 family protein [Bacteroidetes bacterium]|nr:Hsp70 family protein [Bacteroidota bacterium]